MSPPAQFIGYWLAVGFAFACWAWMGKEYDKDILTDPRSIDRTWGPFIKNFMIFLLFLFLRRPMMSLLFIVFLSTMVESMMPVWIPWCCGIFTGAVVWQFFLQTTSALLTAADTMFIAIAIDREHGIDGDANDAFYTLMVDQIAEAKVMDDDGNIVDNPNPIQAQPVASQVV